MAVILTQREKEIAGLLAVYALDDKAIAATLGVTAATVRQHNKNIYDKTGSYSRLQLVVWMYNSPSDILLDCRKAIVDLEIKQ